MTQEIIAHRLKGLIYDWEKEAEFLEEMIDIWENHDDPSCDPGLQYEQEMKVNHAWSEIVNFCKEQLK